MDYPEAHELLATTFAAVNAKLRIAEEHDSVSSQIASVESGADVAVVTASPTYTSGPRLKLIPIKPAPEPLIVGAVWSKEGFTIAAETLLKCAKEVAPKK